MLCEKCKMHPASVFAKKEENNLVNEFYICSQCAIERELSVKLGLYNSNEKFSKLCVCQTTLEEITQSGYVGCINCYKTFEDDLKPIISSLHGRNSHMGKKKLSKLEILSTQLEKARQNNFYKLALKIEDEIKALKGGLNE